MFQFSLSFVALLGLVSPIAGGLAQDRPIQRAHELKRAACTSDNVLSALKSAGATASTFCSSYIGIPVKTVYTDVPGVKATMYNLFTSSRSSELARKSLF